MNYIDICNDRFIIDKLLEIDRKNSSYISHGVKHALNVVENIEKISKLLNVDDITLNYLKIAGYLHDIGSAYGRDEHYLKSRDFAYEYLNGKIETKWLRKILLAIEKHHEKKNVANLTLFEHILLFSDKMDFSHKRLVNDVTDCFENYILDIDFDINKSENIFIIIMSVRNVTAEELFYSWHMRDKVLNRIGQFADKLNMEYEIKFVS